MKKLKYSGYCQSCQSELSLPCEAAIPFALKLQADLVKHQRLDFEFPLSNSNSEWTTHDLFERIGEMMGVLLCANQAGEQVVLKAYSCTHYNHWHIPGWVGPVHDSSKYDEIVAEGNRILHPMTDQIKKLEKGSEARVNMEKMRKSISQDLTQRLKNLYWLHNFKGQKELLYNVFNADHGISLGTGDCCAPKLLNHAAKENLTPISLVEFFWGKTSPDGNRRHQEFYSSCDLRCKPILGFLLCGASHACT